HRATYRKIEVRKRAPKGETGFVVAVENFYFQSGFLAYEREELVAISSVANCARRDDFGALDAQLIGKRCHSAEHSQRVLNCDLAQRAALIESGAQPWGRLHFVDDANYSRRRNVGDRLSNRVRADVDRGHANLRIAPGRGS